ncbi:MAG: hypothetical protein HKO59_15590 [Phycisphaerales bacterium]|nr:hypothetical protein [Phycisphaerae bacterium]NNF41853.1 hypothetical protein [Phycisphaerales bacterium]NNM27378.1 hypothetical protein [Phycisphaerales bacterium]
MRRRRLSPVGAGAIVATLLGVGCATTEMTQTPTPISDRGAIARAVLPSADSGLQVREWHVADTPAADLGPTLLRFGVVDTLEDGVTQGLARNGLRLVLVEVDRVDELLAALGGASLDRDGWYGQAYDWRPVATADLMRPAETVAVDGRVRRLQGGTLRLLVRGWTLLMEDGPVLQLELRAEHDRRQPTRIDQVLGRTPPGRERFDGVAVEVMLEPGNALVLTCESPSVDWDADAAAPATDGGVGPDVAAPLTLGERLLRIDATPPRRGMLVFVPRIPAQLGPPLSPPDDGGDLG